MSNSAFTAFDRFRQAAGTGAEEGPHDEYEHPLDQVEREHIEQQIDESWDIAQREHAEFLRYEAKGQVPRPAEPITPEEERYEFYAQEHIASVWEDAHRENEMLNQQAASTAYAPPPHPHRIAIAARGVAGALMLAIWLFIVGPIWLALLMRTISIYSFATVVALFGGRHPPSPERLDAISGLWMLGFEKIVLTAFKGMPQYAPHLPIDTHLAVRETFLAIFFYTAIYLSIHYVVTLILAGYHYLYDFIILHLF